MQHADSESSVAMTMGPFVTVLMRRPRSVHVDVHVRASIVNVLMGVDVTGQGGAKAPQADTDKHDTRQRLRPKGQGVQREYLAEKERQQSDAHDAAGMSQAPTQAR